jgi:hypothetical protein
VKLPLNIFSSCGGKFALIILSQSVKMRFSPLRHANSLRLAIAFATALALSPASAKESETFVISGSDGYGVSDCFLQGAACGPVMADAWCQSQGRARAIAYGLASDITATIEGAVKAAVARYPKAMLITCSD